MAAADAIIELIDVGQVYATRRGGQVTALANTSLQARSGEFLTIVGPSGCGKTTLLNIVSGLVAPTTGDVLVNGRRGASEGNIGMVFQEPTLLLWRTVLQNVLLPVEIRRLPVAQYEPRARELIAALGLDGFERAYPHELSGGMQQRVAIARSLIIDPPLLLMDEPFSALDAFTRDRLNVELLELWARSRKTVLFVTHNIGEAVFLADRVIVMATRPGRVIADIEVKLSRPRSLDILTSVEYVRYIAEIRRVLQDGGSAE